MIDPMLCSSMTKPEAEKLYAKGDFVVELKMDGIRGIIENGKLFDRRGKDITLLFPELVLSQLDKEVILDGEICAQSGVFSHISGRVHLKDPFAVKLSARMQPAVFVAFDCLHNGKQNIEGESLFIRRAELSGIVHKKQTGWLRLVQGNGGDSDAFARLWEIVELNGLEGVVLKNARSKYQRGIRSSDWVKCKAFSEVENVAFTKLEQHNKGVRLETADGKSVNVNGAQADKVKVIFARDGVVRGDVQFLEQESGQWRFPSWRGLSK
jgi:ATP-dependent DNA ligase